MIYLMNITDAGLKLYEEVKGYLNDIIVLWEKKFENTSNLINELRRIQKLMLESVGDISLE